MEQQIKTPEEKAADSAETKALKSKIKGIVGTLRANWKAADGVALECIMHTLKHDHNAALIGYFANNLLEERAGTMYRALKEAVGDCAAIRFRKSDKPNRITAYKDKKQWKAIKDGASQKAISQLSLKGLRSFLPEPGKKGEGNDPKVKSMSEIMGASIEAGILELEKNPHAKAIAAQFREDFLALHTKMKATLIQFNCTGLVQQMVKAEASVWNAKVKAEEAEEKEKATETSTESKPPVVEETKPPVEDKPPATAETTDDDEYAVPYSSDESTEDESQAA